MKYLCSLLFSFLFYCSKAQTEAKFEPLTIGLTTKIYSSELGETRVINIWLPDGYNPSDTVKYPVIYLLDGGIKEDFLHITGIVQYYTQPWINRFAPSIVVGIENTNRQRDFTFPVSNLDFLKKIGFKKEDIRGYGGSAKFISFLQNELQPFINGHYKTTKSNTIIGESLAGLLATEIYAKHRGLFDTYIIMSPSLWWGNETLTKEIQVDKEKRDISIYIGAPGKADNALMYEDVISLYKTIKSKASQHTKVYFDYLPNETHATVIHPAVFNAFKIIYKK